jgi:hypothetical protein
VLSAPDGAVQVVHEAHRLGAFSRDAWLRLLAGAGFDPEARVGQDAMGGQDDSGRKPRNLFIGRRRA